MVLPTGTVLGLAAWLEPSPAGHSTHLQLGLGTCSFLSLTGHPCPMCGATTTFALMARFRTLEALWNQPFASLLFLVTLGLFSIGLVELVRPRGRWGSLVERLRPWEGWVAGGGLALMGASWVWKVWLMAAASS